MGKVFYVLRNESGSTCAFVGTHGQFISDLFMPTVSVECAFELSVPGKTYAERKANLREKAVDFSNADGGGLSIGEIVELNNFFEANGKRYGLFNEFRNNGIC